MSVCLSTNIGNDAPINLIVTTSHKATSGLSHNGFPYYNYNCHFPDGDYDGVPQVVQIPVSSGASRVCVDIPITDDTILEENEDFCVSFEIPPGTNANSGMITTTRVLIVDDDSK